MGWPLCMALLGWDLVGSHSPGPLPQFWPNTLMEWFGSRVFYSPCYFETAASWVAVAWVDSHRESLMSGMSHAWCLGIPRQWTISSATLYFCFGSPHFDNESEKWVVLGFLNCTHGASWAECSLLSFCVTDIWVSTWCVAGHPDIGFPARVPVWLVPFESSNT